MLSVPSGAPLILTVGNAHKYCPMGDLNFIAAAKRILAAHPSAHLVAVGPSSDAPAWREACAATAGRIKAVGKQVGLRRYFAASDLYLEGFPISSLTALLEAALSGLACVPAPLSCWPVISDDPAILRTGIPADAEAYVAEACRLLVDVAARQERARRQRADVVRYHCKEGWSSFLDEALQLLPQSHSVAAPSAVAVLPDALAAFMTLLKTGSFGNFRTSHPREFSVKEALRFGLYPRPQEVGAERAGPDGIAGGVRQPLRLLLSFDEVWAQRVVVAVSRFVLGHAEGSWSGCIHFPLRNGVLRMLARRTGEIFNRRLQLGRQ